METALTKAELIDLLRMSGDIPDDALVCACDAETGRMARVIDFTYDARTNALRIQTDE
ncbi:hypothetical protein [Paraburkholderia sp. BR14320]|uniref:hypothetical protein n=1 Tax=unclassified Paraburkholderia TaxID=2615204 RepID=UPI0034CD0235